MTNDGKQSEQLQILEDVINKAADNTGEDVYDYLENVLMTSLAVDLFNALNELGYEITKK